jgi:hypothetical protein
VTRERQADKTCKLDYYLSSATADFPLMKFAGMAKAAHRIEECFERAKGEAGLRDYSSAKLDSLASSPNSVTASRVVAEQRDATGKKTNASSDDTATTKIDRRANRYSPADESSRFAVSP